MPALLGALVGLALVDSFNPSAIVVTILLLTAGASSSRVLTYVSAIFATYFVAGLALMLGIDAFADRFADLLENPVAYGAQLVLGGAMLLFALLGPDEKAGERTEPALPTPRGPFALFALGVTISVVEVPTAFPYLGAIALMTREEPAVIEWLPLLVLYNAILVTPPLVILAGYRAFGARIEPLLARIRGRLASGMRETLLWVVGLIGFFLLADALSYFEFFGLVDD